MCVCVSANYTIFGSDNGLLEVIFIGIKMKLLSFKKCFFEIVVCKMNGGVSTSACDLIAYDLTVRVKWFSWLNEK